MARDEQAIHQPTARRIADARRAGVVAHSADLRAALALAAVGCAIAGLAPAIVGQLVAIFTDGLRGASRGDQLAAAGARALDSGVRVLAVPLSVAFVATLLAGLLQTRGLWVGSPSGAGPAAGSRGAPWRRWRAGPALAAGAGIVLKTGFLALVAAALLSPLLRQSAGLAGLPAARALAAFGAGARFLGARLLAALLLVGAADYLWARASHRRALRMTTRELERERREREGDPQARAARRRRHGELTAAGSAGDLRSAVAAADVVVTAGAAGAHDARAVALCYQPSGGAAPIVVAAGRRAAAAPIIAAARAAGVAMVQDAALSAALVDVPAGAEIPAAVFERVAEIYRDLRAYPAGGSRPAAMPHGASFGGA